jgi:phage gpG-like protein
MQATVKLQGTQIVLRQLDSLDGRVRQEVGQALARGLQYAVGISQRSFLRGPRPARLGVVTGRLFGSITSRVDHETDRIVGAIGTNVFYGAFHEFGFQGTQQVKAHTRVIRIVASPGQGMAPVTFGRSGGPGTRAASAAGQGTARKLGKAVISKEVEQVRAHTRTLNYAGKPFLRPALQQALPRILREVNAGVKKALEGQ